MEEKLGMHLALARTDLDLRIEGGKIEFEQAAVRGHREMKAHLLHNMLGVRPLIALIRQAASWSPHTRATQVLPTSVNAVAYRAEMGALNEKVCRRRRVADIWFLTLMS